MYHLDMKLAFITESEEPQWKLGHESHLESNKGVNTNPPFFSFSFFLSSGHGLFGLGT